MVSYITNFYKNKIIQELEITRPPLEQETSLKVTSIYGTNSDKNSPIFKPVMLSNSESFELYKKSFIDLCKKNTKWNSIPHLEATFKTLRFILSQSDKNGKFISYQACKESISEQDWNLFLFPKNFLPYTTSIYADILKNFSFNRFSLRKKDPIYKKMATELLYKNPGKKHLKEFYPKIWNKYSILEKKNKTNLNTKKNGIADDKNHVNKHDKKIERELELINNLFSENIKEKNDANIFLGKNYDIERLNKIKHSYEECILHRLDPLYVISATAAKQKVYKWLQKEVGLRHLEKFHPINEDEIKSFKRKSPNWNLEKDTELFINFLKKAKYKISET